MFEMLINTNVVVPPPPPVGILLRLNATSATTITTQYKFVSGSGTFKYQINDGPVITPGASITIPAGETIFNLIPDPNVITLKASVRPGDFEGLLTEVIDWANPGTHNVSFSGATKLTKVPDYLPTMITSMDQMFRSCSIFNQNINNWDVSNVTSMAECFSVALAFNQPLNNWNTGNVTTMLQMFNVARAFNQNINNWDVRKVTNMRLMFAGNGARFNQPLDNWQTDSLVTAARAFENNTAFNRPIGTWNVSKVNDISGLMHRASAFNQNLSNWTFDRRTVTFTDYDLDATSWIAANKPTFYTS